MDYTVSRKELLDYVHKVGATKFLDSFGWVIDQDSDIIPTLDAACQNHSITYEEFANIMTKFHPSVNENVQ
jgi:hypothetical protein